MMMVVAMVVTKRKDRDVITQLHTKFVEGVKYFGVDGDLTAV
jgi:hypothetical protein